MRRNHGLDLLRAVAILLVMMWHFPKSDGHSVFGIFGQKGIWGVDLFFVLSGYLIGDGLQRSRVAGSFRFSNFYARRTLRTLPCYFVVVALYFLIPAFREKPEIPPFWKFLTFTQNFGLELSAFSHAWSLCIEEQFYLGLPLFAVFLLPVLTGWRGPLLLVIAVLAGMVLRAWLWNEFVATDARGVRDAYMTFIYYPTWSRLDGLLCGVGLAILKNSRSDVWARWSLYANRFLAMGIAVVIVAMWILEDRSKFLPTIFGFPVLALGYAMIVFAAATDQSWLRRQVPGAAILATLAYSLYLLHKQMFHLVRGPWSIAAALAAAAALHHLIERPFLSWREKLAPAARAR